MCGYIYKSDFQKIRFIFYGKNTALPKRCVLDSITTIGNGETFSRNSEAFTLEFLENISLVPHA